MAGQKSAGLRTFSSERTHFSEVDRRLVISAKAATVRLDDYRHQRGEWKSPVGA